MGIITGQYDNTLGALGRLSSLKSLLGLTNSTYDEYLKYLLLNSTSVFERAVRRCLRLKKRKETYTVTDGGTRLYPTHYPLTTSITTSRAVPELTEDKGATVDYMTIDKTGLMYTHLGTPDSTSRNISSYDGGRDYRKSTRTDSYTVNWRSLDGTQTKKSIELSFNWSADDRIIEIGTAPFTTNTFNEWCIFNNGRKLSKFDAVVSVDGTKHTLAPRTSKDVENADWGLCRLYTTYSTKYPTLEYMLMKYVSEPIELDWYENDSPFSSTKIKLHVIFPIGYWKDTLPHTGVDKTEGYSTVDAIVLTTGNSDFTGSPTTEVYGTDYKIIDDRYIYSSESFSSATGDVVLDYYGGYDTGGWDYLGIEELFGVPPDLEEVIVEDAAIQSLKKIPKDDNIGMGLLGVNATGRNGESVDYASFIDGYHARFRAALRSYRGYTV